MTIREKRDGGITESGIRWRSTVSFPAAEEDDPAALCEFYQKAEETLAAPLPDSVFHTLGVPRQSSGRSDCIGREAECRITCRTMPFFSVVWDIRYGFGHTLLLWKRETQNWLIVPKREKGGGNDRKASPNESACFLLPAPRLKSDQREQVQNALGGKPDGFFLTDSSFVFYRIVPPDPDRPMRRSLWQTLLRETALPRETVPSEYRFLLPDSTAKTFS